MYNDHFCSFISDNSLITVAFKIRRHPRALIIHKTEFELISWGQTAGVNPNRVDRGNTKSCMACRKFVRLRPDASNYRPRRRQTLTLLLAACRSTKVLGSRCHFVPPYRNFRVVFVRGELSGSNAFSLFSHSSFPGWSVVDVIHRRERNFVVSR